MMKSQVSPTREKEVFFLLFFSHFHCVQSESELSLQMECRNGSVANCLCRWSVGTGVLRCLCKCHVVLLKPCIFSHPRPAIFLSVPFSGRKKKHLEATGGPGWFGKPKDVEDYTGTPSQLRPTRLEIEGDSGTVNDITQISETWSHFCSCL